VLTLAEAAAYLRLPPQTQKRDALAGRLPGRRVGRRWRFLKTSLDDWLRQPDGRTILLGQAGAFADNPTLPNLRAAAYEARCRPESE